LRGAKGKRAGDKGKFLRSEASLDTEAELRISRVRALTDKDLLAVMTYLLARHPDTFPPMLDDALSSVSPKDRG
jgi:hypothetical protein